MPDYDSNPSALSTDRPSTSLGSAVADVGSRIQEILDLAEEAAGEIRAEAEHAGRSYLRDRQREADRIVHERLSELDAITESLAARATSVEREATAFAAEVEQVRWRLARLVGESPPEPVPGNDVPRDATRPRHASDLTAARDTQVAALRATQMAVAGAARSEIETMLRDQFGMSDRAAIDGVLRTGGL